MLQNLKKIVSDKPYLFYFIGVFIYVHIIGIFIQIFFLPSIPELHYGYGLLKGGDWEHFHDTAVLCSKIINGINYSKCENLYQWQDFILIPSYTYYFSGISAPWVILPFNALFFATSATTLAAIYAFFSKKNNAMIATLPFILYPSAAIIYGQIHKDVISICGIFIIIYINIYVINSDENLKICKIIKLFILGIFANMMIILVRPYLLQVLTFGIFFALLIYIAIKRKYLINLFLLIALIITHAFFIYINNLDSQNISKKPDVIRIEESIALRSDVIKSKESNSLEAVELNIVDKVVRKLGSTREAFANGYPNAKSNIDLDIKFESLLDIFSYSPRAIQIGLFSPFPSQWFTEGKSEVGSMMRIISSIEMMVGYLLFVGLLFNFSVNKCVNKIDLLIAFIIPLIILTITSLVVCNVGTLYRMRYGSWQLLNGFGLLGWIYFFKWKFKR